MLLLCYFILAYSLYISILTFNLIFYPYFAVTVLLRCITYQKRDTIPRKKAVTTDSPKTILPQLGLWVS